MLSAIVSLPRALAVRRLRLRIRKTRCSASLSGLLRWRAQWLLAELRFQTCLHCAQLFVSFRMQKRMNVMTTVKCSLRVCVCWRCLGPKGLRQF